jgi:RNA polymerase subunit RPABC4/transcription elongation factor Spt4
MHQIPCHNCQFFTNNYRLKCTVHPSIANTEEAIDCSDYQPKTNPFLY